jgi:hypothetical protein
VAVEVFDYAGSDWDDGDTCEGSGCLLVRMRYLFVGKKVVGVGSRSNSMTNRSLKSPCERNQNDGKNNNYLHRECHTRKQQHSKPLEPQTPILRIIRVQWFEIKNDFTVLASARAVLGDVSEQRLLLVHQRCRHVQWCRSTERVLRGQNSYTNDGWGGDRESFAPYGCDTRACVR